MGRRRLASIKQLTTAANAATRIRRTHAKYLSAISLFLLVHQASRAAGPVVQARLIKVYHKYQTDGEDGGEPGSALTQSASNLAQLRQLAAGSEESPRMSTIEFNSPMKRIMDLIGHHAPVIVLDSSSGDHQSKLAAAGQPDEGAQQQQHHAIVASAPPTVAHFGGIPTQAVHQHQQAPILVGGGGEPSQAPQQQHWTILDAGQMGGQQPAGQQQQLIQSTAIPNEQYFTFTPFGLAPASSPFAGQHQSFIAYPQQPQQPQQQQQQQQEFGPAAGQMPQSSQNYQQQQQQQNEVQPVFLSSYVPELPAPPSQSSAFGGAATFSAGPSHYVTGAQQPNSIQQIQQAQQQQQQQQPAEPEPAARAKPREAPPTTEAAGEQDAAGEQEAKSAAKDEDEPSSGGHQPAGEADSAAGADSDEETADSKRPSSSGDAEPSSGSMSYEDKYDSDKDDAPRQKSSSSVAAASAATAAAASTNGLVSVGLNDDCLQCICRASSGCDHLLRCITIGAEEKYCGPFQLTEEYWQKAGSPGDAQNNFSSFEDCANDADCAVETVTDYMKKYFRDCDGDDKVTCMDYARLHRLRPDECDQTSRLFSKELDSYWEKFQRCAESYNRTRNGDDEDI
jgi:hypothetical protein